jgi:hypothetical protein
LLVDTSELDDGEQDTSDGSDSDEERHQQDEADLARFNAALLALDNDSLREGLASMDEKALQEMAGHLNLPRATIHLGDALVPLVRRKLRAAHPEHQLNVAFAMTDDINHDTVEALGEHAEDPSREELLEALPGVLDEHATPLVTLMMSAYAVSDAPCRAVMRDLLETDERFSVPEPSGDGEGSDDEVPTFGALPPSRHNDDDPELAAKREQRREAKAARKEAAARQKQARVAGEAKRREALHQAKKRRPAH